MMLVTATLCLIGGTCIYLKSRNNIIFFDWIPSSVITIIKDIPVIYPSDRLSWLRNFLIFNLPDGLWYAALLLFQISFLSVKDSISKLIFYFSATVPFIWELLQILHEVPGRFDIMDMLTYFIVLLIVCLSLNIKRCSRKKE